jgi:hypothetical protein
MSLLHEYLLFRVSVCQEETELELCRTGLHCEHYNDKWKFMARGWERDQTMGNYYEDASWIKGNFCLC